MWAFSLLDQDDLANAASIHKDRVRAILGRTNPKQATLEELYALAKAVSAPRAFVDEGFAGLENRELERRVDRLAADLARTSAQLRTLAEATITRLNQLEAATPPVTELDGGDLTAVLPDLAPREPDESQKPEVGDESSNGQEEAGSGGA